ncbi:MAG: PIN domain-containing protein [Alphaproteobacteria bacterium]
MTKHFLDTNILIYAAQNRREQLNKREIAKELIKTTDFGLSAQVLAEFYVIVTQKGDPPMTPDAALAWVEELEQLPCVSLDSSLVKLGAETSVRYRISYWDGAIIAAAERLGAEILFTEDLNHGQSYGQVRALNPFL